MSDTSENPAQERLRRWRLLLGGEASDGIGGAAAGELFSLSADDQRMDAALAALYDAERSGGLGRSAPGIARWLGDIRSYFPTAVVRVMQHDALERLNLKQMLLEPELLETVEADMQLVTTLLTLKDAMPAQTRDTARQVVGKVVGELQRKLESPLRQAIVGSLHRATRKRRPRHNEIDWQRTIRANLKHYQPQYRTIIPETRIGYGRCRSSLHDVILCIDQSGSMAASVVYASIFGAVMASLPALTTHMVVFDTAVVDLTADLHDPVDLLFGMQLGGGTDINRALTYCQQLIARPNETTLVLISDLYEGGNRAELVRRAAELAGAGVQLIALLALSDAGAPAYDHAVSAQLAALGVPAFACSPELFPDLMATALNRRDLTQWVARNTET